MGLIMKLTCFGLACNHAALITKDFNNDRDALEPRPVSAKGDDDDGLADMLAGLGVSDTTRKCQVCQTVYVDSSLLSVPRLMFTA